MSIKKSFSTTASRLAYSVSATDIGDLFQDLEDGNIYEAVKVGTGTACWTSDTMITVDASLNSNASGVQWLKGTPPAGAKLIGWLDTFDNGDGTNNDVMRFGWNIAHGGGVTDNTRPAVALELESYWKSGARHQVEFHLAAVATDGTVMRPISWSCDDLKSISLSFTSDSFSWNDHASGVAWLNIGGKQLRFANGGNIRWDSNNYGITAVNAANNAYKAMIKLNASDQVEIGEATVPAYVPGGVLQTSLVSYCTADFAKTSDTTLANATGLSATVVAAGVYAIRAVLDLAANAAGGHKIAIGGTATATAIAATVRVLDTGTMANVLTSKITALATGVGVTSSATALANVDGYIIVNSAGTLTIQYAQNASNGAASTVLKGSVLELTRIA